MFPRRLSLKIMLELSGRDEGYFMRNVMKRIVERIRKADAFNAGLKPLKMEWGKMGLLRHGVEYYSITKIGECIIAAISECDLFVFNYQKPKERSKNDILRP
jgi:hypothetical protein